MLVFNRYLVEMNILTHQDICYNVAIINVSHIYNIFKNGIFGIEFIGNSEFRKKSAAALQMASPFV